MEEGTLKAAQFLSKSVTGGFVVNGQIINALNCLMLSSDDNAMNLSRQIVESINKLCNNLLNESVSHREIKPIVKPQEKCYSDVAEKASNLCW